jgi:hypothetical protein
VSKVFPRDKDLVIDELDDDYKLNLSEEEYERLRQLTLADLFFLTQLFARFSKAVTK